MPLEHDGPTAKPLLSAAGGRLARVTDALLTGIALASGSAAIAQPAPMARAGITALTGTWRVVAVRVDDSPVQVLVPNDPSYMGALLDVTPARLAWRRPHKAPSLSFTCSRPRVVDKRMICRNGDFGPPGSRVTRPGKRLAIEWFDGATLILERAP